MNTLTSSKTRASYSDGFIVVSMEGGIEIKFPAGNNSKLKNGTPNQLNNIEISPFGIHWPDLDEDLSFEGLSRGNFGQYSNR